jgi:hypothetical protein
MGTAYGAGHAKESVSHKVTESRWRSNVWTYPVFPSSPACNECRAWRKAQHRLGLGNLRTDLPQSLHDRLQKGSVLKSATCCRVESWSTWPKAQVCRL